MDKKDITNANREAWNEVTPVHQKARKVRLVEQFKQPWFSTLDDLITSKLNEIGLNGKTIGQPCCNNGRETVSLLNLGAKSAVGFDISDAAIEEAREIAKSAGVECEFVRTDVYDIGTEYYNRFDIIYISIGAISWMPDLEGFYQIVSKMLKNEGVLLMYEQHPVLYMFATEADPEWEKDHPLNAVFSYFRKEPWEDTTGIDYIGGTTYEAKPSYSYTQTMSDIINAVIKSGITLEEFNEYAHDISEVWKPLEKDKILPCCYILVGRKS